MCGAGDSEEWWCDVFCLHPILGHLIQVRSVHVSVIVPSETVEGDEQQLVPGRPRSCSVLQWGSRTRRVANEAQDSKTEQQHYRGVAPRLYTRLYRLKVSECLISDPQFIYFLGLFSYDLFTLSFSTNYLSV